MSKIIKLIVWVIIIIAIIFLGKVFLGDSVAQAPTQEDQERQMNAELQGSADVGIDQDLAGVDAQMDGLASDSATVDEGINAQ